MLGFNMAQMQLERSRREKNHFSLRENYRRQLLNQNDFEEIN